MYVWWWGLEGGGYSCQRVSEECRVLFTRSHSLTARTSPSFPTERWLFVRSSPRCAARGERQGELAQL